MKGFFHFLLAFIQQLSAQHSHERRFALFDDLRLDTGGILRAPASQHYPPLVVVCRLYWSM